MSEPLHFLSKEDLLNVFDTTPTATAVHVGEDARIQTANDAMLKIWGKSRENVIGKSLEEALPELKGQPFIDMFKRVWNEGLTISGSDTAADLEIDGRIKTFYFNFEYRAIKDETGKTICVLHTAIDVTDRVLKQEAIEYAHEKDEALKREQALNEELAAANEELNAINEELQEAQESLRILNSDLEARVLERVKDLSESEARFRRMAEGTDILIAVGDENSHAIFFNSAWTSMTGQSMEELLHSGWTNLIHPDDQNRYQERYHLSLVGKVPFTDELRILNHSGNYRWLLATATPRFKADGSFAGFISSAVDITDRKHMELEQEKLNKIIESSLEFIGLSGLDGSMQYANPVALKKLGWKNIENRNILDCVFPEDREFATRVLTELINNGKSSHEIRFYNQETGIPFWIEWNSFAIRNLSSDDIIAYATVSPDITERKLYQEDLQQVNEELAASNEELAATNEELAQTHNHLVELISQLSDSEQKLNQAIEAAKMGTWSIDPVTLKVSMSAFVKEMLGLDPDQEPEMDKIMQAVHPDYHDMLYSALNNAIQNHLPSDTEYPITNLINGKLKWVKATGKIFLDKSGNPAEYSGLFMDITERKLDEIRKNDFIGMVSHELKTPLTAINGFVQILQHRANKSEDAFSASALNKTYLQVKKMNTMINGFLNVSRLESGKLLIEKSTFSLNALLEESIEENFVSQSSHQIVLHPAEEIEVFADRDKIGNVISNLLSNAFKYSANGSKVEIKSNVIDGQAVVSISDEGIGINREDAAKLFERYYRVESHHTISGFGIGLYLSAEIIQRHQGKIWLESEPDKGSVFHFSIPLKDPK